MIVEQRLTGEMIWRKISAVFHLWKFAFGGWVALRKIWIFISFFKGKRRSVVQKKYSLYPLKTVGSYLVFRSS